MRARSAHSVPMAGPGVNNGPGHSRGASEAQLVGFRMTFQLTYTYAIEGDSVKHTCTVAHSYQDQNVYQQKCKLTVRINHVI